MIVLGVDPGLATTGYGIVREQRDGSLDALAYGIIETPKGFTLPQRLAALHDQLRTLIAKWQPNAAAIESLFFATNARTAMSVGQARGVVLLTLHQAGLSIAEYTPLQVKQTVSGYGQADKQQMQRMVQLLLRLPTLPRPDDAADALAVAITHVHHQRWS
ncbi:MAG: crossover junction endodeoxyribonuclease RuvC [Anaerolineae bacterium]|nr:crossover junction endodeoxyribonuclease RuvC [Thermoflexales bacterium]MDW8053150.1 crossover junction endodeoxyribonuclease RuvC [Anaerolineae bacterium]MDW8291802.1 crossover junction endodeoxyribonuclease RuvC [Anaerolineae bacterium]